MRLVWPADVEHALPLQVCYVAGAELPKRVIAQPVPRPDETEHASRHPPDPGSGYPGGEDVHEQPHRVGRARRFRGTGQDRPRVYVRVSLFFFRAAVALLYLLTSWVFTKIQPTSMVSETLGRRAGGRRPPNRPSPTRDPNPNRTIDPNPPNPTTTPHNPPIPPHPPPSYLTHA